MKLRVTFVLSVEISGYDVIEAASGNDVLKVAIRQLNPLTEQVIRHPVHEMVEV